MSILIFENLCFRSKGELPWTQALLAMANSSNPATVAVIDNVFREMDPDDFPLNQGVNKPITNCNQSVFY